jgi:hypothetical protein
MRRSQKGQKGSQEADRREVLGRRMRREGGESQV